MKYTGLFFVLFSVAYLLLLIYVVNYGAFNDHNNNATVSMDTSGIKSPDLFKDCDSFKVNDSLMIFLPKSMTE